MKNAYIDLIKYTLVSGCSISVWDGEEWQVKRSGGYKAIKDAIESVEESQIRIRNAEGEVMGWARIIPSLENDETVADFSCTPFMEGWDDQYQFMK